MPSARVLVDAAVAVAVRDVDLAARRDADVGRMVEGRAGVARRRCASACRRLRRSGRLARGRPGCSRCRTAYGASRGSAGACPACRTSGRSAGSRSTKYSVSSGVMHIPWASSKMPSPQESISFAGLVEDPVGVLGPGEDVDVVVANPRPRRRPGPRSSRRAAASAPHEPPVTPRLAYWRLAGPSPSR